MSDIGQQVHHRFRVFSGRVDSAGGIQSVADEVARFVAQSGVSARSIGVEFLEAEQQVLLTLGYRDDEPGFNVEVKTVNLGQVKALDAANFRSLEAAMERASARFSNVICHAEYVLSDGTFTMVFLVSQ